MKLLKHQADAIKEFHEHFIENERGVLVMCCGSGKTYTSYNIIKTCITMISDNIFMYVTPRLALVSQLYYDIIKWCTEDKLHLVILVVCSATIKFKEDEYYTIKNVNSECIYNECLNNRHKNILIITTYDTSNNIKTDFSRPDQQINIDLMLLDEAHHTAGMVSDKNKYKNSQKLIEPQICVEDVLFASKILFMTATPIININMNPKSINSDNNIRFSMNNKKIYGDIFYEYSFKQGIIDQYILPWTVLHLKKCKDIPTDIENALNHILPNQKALVTIEVQVKFLLYNLYIYNLRNCIIYLPSIEYLNLFDTYLKHALQYHNKLHKDYVNIFSIYSKHGKTEKENTKTLQDFSKYSNRIQKILLSVAMCDEGVDIPICDSVMFTSSKESNNVIIQNIGRSLRNYTSTDKTYVKTNAYVLIPCTVYDYDISKSEQIAYSSHYNEIRKVSDDMKKDDALRCQKYIKNLKSDKEIVRATPSNLIVQKEEEEDHSTFADAIFDAMNVCATDGTVSNSSLNKYRIYIRQHNITTLTGIYTLTESYKITLHEEYNIMFICYAELIYSNDAVYTYDEAVLNISKLDLSNINSWHQWTEYRNNMLTSGLTGTCTNTQALDILMKIPHHPKDYYNDSWVSLNEFFSKDMEAQKVIQGMYKKVIQNALRAVVNNDEKVLPIKSHDFITYVIKPYDLITIKSYITNRFNMIGEYSGSIKIMKKSKKFMGFTVSIFKNGVTVMIIHEDGITYRTHIGNKYNNDMEYWSDIVLKDMLKIKQELEMIINDIKSVYTGILFE
jgi:superfamily II DNA or RNA helicase